MTPELPLGCVDDHVTPMTNPYEPEPPPKSVRWQFTLGGLFRVTLAFAVSFGILRALGLTPMVSMLVTLLLLGSLAAAFGLIVAILRSEDGE